MYLNGTQILETPRLTLRPFRVEDAEDMFNNWASDPEVTRFLTWPAHKSVDITRMLLEDWTTRYEDKSYFQWAIVLKESESVIGSIAVVDFKDPW